jgi:XTP/dITP diphosphohydrolase
MPKNQKNTHFLLFATSNSNKVEEAKLILRNYPIEIQRIDLKGREIQAETVEEIAIASAQQVFKKIGKAVFTEDAGLFIKALNGFPGPFTAYVYKTIGISGVLKLLKDVKDRRAEFRSAVAFCSREVKNICFVGVALGRISQKERGIHGFGFDPIFEPDGGGNKTFAEMTIDKKNAYSHRARAMKKFIEWYI